MFHSRHLNNHIDHIHEWALKLFIKIIIPLLKNYLEKTKQTLKKRFNRILKAKVNLHFERYS